MSSTTHEKMLKLSEKFENKDELIEYHETILSRIYPKGINIFSGNFNPVPHWKTGVQIAALNLQTTGPKLRINSAMFRQNGNSGYVVKPCLKKVNLFSLNLDDDYPSMFLFFFPRNVKAELVSSK